MQAIFYVPQKPYTTTGTLREQVIYPLTVDQAAPRADGQSKVRHPLSYPCHHMDTQAMLS